MTRPSLQPLSSTPPKVLRADPPGPLPRPAQPLLRPHPRTTPLIWLIAFLCSLLILLLIFAGILTLLVFLILKPRIPSFDAAAASLNSLYIDSPPSLLNADLTLLANFSNPNRRIDVAFERGTLELYFAGRRIAAQMLPPFERRRGQAGLLALRMISSQVGLPPQAAAELQRQVRANRVLYSVRGAFRVRASFGFGHFSYWLYGRCRIELTGPPGGVLLARSCGTRR